MPSSYLATVKEGSSYESYLRDIVPVGERMRLVLRDDTEALEDSERELVCFFTQKVAEDLWDGVPGFADAVTSRALFEYVRDIMAEDDTHDIVV